MSLNGEPTLLPTIDVIILQLLQKEMVGDARARSVMLKYEEFANRHVERSLAIQFGAESYAQAVTEQGGTNG